MSYARGPKAVGLCQRSGKKLLRRDMLEDEYMEGLLVAPEWWEPKHPQELPVDTSEHSSSIYKPAPDPDRLALSVIPDGDARFVLQMNGDVGYSVAYVPSVLSIGGPYSASFFDSSVTVTVTRTGSEPCSATITFSDGDAAAGTDYTSTPILVEFNALETSKDVLVPLIPADYDAEVLATARTYHKLDEASGTTALDSGPAGYDLTQVGGTLTRQQARLNVSGALPTAFAGNACVEVVSSTFTELKGNIDFNVDGWAYHSAIPDNGDVGTYWVNGGITSDASSATNWQFWCGAFNSSGTMHPWLFWEFGGGSNVQFTFTTITIPLNTEVYFSFGRDVSTGMVWARCNNQYEEQAYTNGPNGGTDIALGIGNNRDHGGNFDLVGRIGQVACYLNDTRPARYDRWKIGATRSFTATLGTPVSCTISDDTAPINLSETG